MAISDGRPDGLARYHAEVPACPFAFDIVDGAVLVPAQITACVFKAADCQTSPSGLWGPDGTTLGADAAAIGKQRTEAENAMARALHALEERAKDNSDAAALVRDQSGFAGERDDICRDYVQEARAWILRRERDRRARGAARGSARGLLGLGAERREIRQEREGGQGRQAQEGQDRRGAPRPTSRSSRDSDFRKPALFRRRRRLASGGKKSAVIGRAATRGCDMGMWQEFKEFALKGNALALAVGVIIGAAFGKIVDALVNDLIMPVVGIAGKADFSNYYIPLSSAVTATNLADARKQGGVFAYGDFITVAINFAIVAVALFLLIKGINILTRADKAKPAEPPPPSPEVVLLTEIRDQLARRSV